MSAPGNPTWTRGSRQRGGAWSRHQASYTGPHLRVSDAERAQAADQLSRHYADGRLDEATFNERLDQAMSAKTQADLSGLFTDLPGTGRPPAEMRREAAAGRDRRARHRRILFLVLVIALTAAVGNALAHAYVFWVLFCLAALGWLYYGPRRRDR